MRNLKPILLVEDDRVDIMTTQRAFKELKIPNQLPTTGNGEEALEYLKDENTEKPCLVLLDLNMPRMNGIEFLEIIKQDDNLKKIPVIILTTSNEEKDKIESFRLSVAGYMVKPIDYQQFVEVIKTIDIYWTTSELPEDSKLHRVVPEPIKSDVS